ncbi:hypothetical protein OEZ71_06110 [Defluviimonas sp. WL0050]|uniref:Uncharacterized protein n=1 Tax=Albidovulum litorale TaxID=2984134 RepID=A0ABT2ZL55_9RHOB|nr:hypothetical protein [Defluviimonas sp. WL0050]MCV2871866.1 hypothetical protein [Defluviimonas sp. WL0050]
MTVFPTKLLLAALMITAFGVTPAASQFGGPVLPRLTFPDPAPTDGQETDADCPAQQTCPTKT